MPARVKRCKTCRVPKSEALFYFRQDTQKYHPDCIACYRVKDNARQPEYYQRNRERAIEKTRRWRAALRAEVLAAYGGKCTCCGESEPKFLALNHVDGGGNAHRRSLGRAGRGSSMQVYKDVKNRGFPPDFNLLCHNCNVAEGFYGVCPHQAVEVNFGEGQFCLEQA